MCDRLAGACKSPYVLAARGSDQTLVNVVQLSQLVLTLSVLAVALGPGNGDGSAR